jgi:hypothetical protein
MLTSFQCFQLLVNLSSLLGSYTSCFSSTKTLRSICVILHLERTPLSTILPSQSVLPPGRSHAVFNSKTRSHHRSRCHPRETAASHGETAYISEMPTTSPSTNLIFSLNSIVFLFDSFDRPLFIRVAINSSLNITHFSSPASNHTS